MARCRSANKAHHDNRIELERSSIGAILKTSLFLRRLLNKGYL